MTLAGLQNAVPLPVSARGNASLVPSILSTLPVAIYLNSMFQSEQDATAWALVNLYPACTDTSKRVATQVCPGGVMQHTSNSTCAASKISLHAPAGCGTQPTNTVRTLACT